jgi:radical SAM-linked protein
MWERALRRSGLAVAWSEGFSPRPLLSFGLALPTGAESTAEYLDVRLEAPVESPSDLAPTMTDLLPGGVDVQAAAAMPHGAGSLQQEVSSCSWELEVLGVTAQDLTTRVEQLLDAESVVVRRERKGRSVDDDLRPAILELATVSGPVPGSCHLRAVVVTHPRGIRPGELLEGLGAGLTLARACRTHQWIERDGTRIEPLTASGELPEVVAGHAGARAS